MWLLDDEYLCTCGLSLLWLPVCWLIVWGLEKLGWIKVP